MSWTVPGRLHSLFQFRPHVLPRLVVGELRGSEGFVPFTLNPPLPANRVPLPPSAPPAATPQLLLPDSALPLVPPALHGAALHGTYAAPALDEPHTDAAAAAHGTLLLDRSLAQPVQVAAWAGGVDDVYVHHALDTAVRRRAALVDPDGTLRRAEDDGVFVPPAFVPRARGEAALTERPTRDAPRDDGRVGLAAALELPLHETSACCLVNGAPDGLPALTVEKYGSYALVQQHSASWDVYQRVVTRALLSHPLLRLRGVYWARRVRDGEGDAPRARCVAGQRAPEHCAVLVEHGVAHEVYLNRGHGAGFALEHRENRQRVYELLRNQPQTLVPLARRFIKPKDGEPLAQQRRRQEAQTAPTLLHPFAGSCAFGLSAARAGAVALNIDMDAAALGQGRRLLTAMRHTDGAHHTFWPKEPLRALHALRATNRLFDFVVLDPPATAHINRGGKVGFPKHLQQGTAHQRRGRFTFSALAHYRLLVALAAPLVAPGGHLLVSCDTATLSKSEYDVPRRPHPRLEQHVQQGVELARAEEGRLMFEAAPPRRRSRVPAALLERALAFAPRAAFPPPGDAPPPLVAGADGTLAWGGRTTLLLRRDAVDAATRAQVGLDDGDGAADATPEAEFKRWSLPPRK